MTSRAGRAGERAPPPRELEPPVSFERPYLMAAGVTAPLVRHRYIFDFAANEIHHLVRFLYCLTTPTSVMSLDEVRGLRLKETTDVARGRAFEYILEVFDARFKPHVVGQAGLARLSPLLERAHAIARILRCPLVVPAVFLETPAPGYLPPSSEDPVNMFGTAVQILVTARDEASYINEIRSRLAGSPFARRS